MLNEKLNTRLCIHFSQLPGLKCWHNSSRLINGSCEWILTTGQDIAMDDLGLIHTRRQRRRQIWYKVDFFCGREWNALLQMWVFPLDDDNKLKCDDVVMNWVLYPFHDNIVIMILLIVLISRRQDTKLSSSSANEIYVVVTNRICHRRLVQTSPYPWWSLVNTNG